MPTTYETDARLVDLADALRSAGSTTPPDYVSFLSAAGSVIASGASPRRVTAELRTWFETRQTALDELGSRFEAGKLSPDGVERARRTLLEFKLLLSLATRFPPSWQEAMGAAAALVDTD